MSNKILQYLTDLEAAIDKMSDEELTRRVLDSGVTPQIASQYAIIERMLLDEPCSDVERKK